MDFKLNAYYRRNVPDEELLEDVRYVANKLSKSTLTRNEYINNGGKFGIDTVSRRFGGWINVLRLCGLTPSEMQLGAAIATRAQDSVSVDELISDLILVSNKINKTTFTSREYDTLGTYSSCTYFRRFKTWNNA
jgi:hypothetical protein